MTLKPSKIGRPDLSPEGAENESAGKAHFVKARFVKPQLTCHGSVVDLTQQFGGSLTPDEREALGLD